MANRQAARATGTPAGARSDAVKPTVTPVAEGDVDTSVLDKLIEITRQQRQLDEYRTRAEAKKDKVDPAVYRKVIEDYRKRDTALDKQAQPLKAQARQEFEKLRVVFDAVTGREERARYDKQELEFRQEIGEIDDQELAERLKEPEAILDECRSELEALGKQKARFLEAFDEEELATPTREDLSAVTAESDAPPELADRPDVTMISTVKETSATVPNSLSHVSGEAPSLQADDDESAEHTFMLPEGLLVGGDPDGGAEVEYRLSAINYIGRSEDNQIRILRAGVSRRHALIVAEKTAFLIRDLRSQNGTFVNDEQIEERTLSDGDTIRLGEAQLVFRAPKGR